MEHPMTLGASEALKIRAVNPDQTARHHRIISQNNQSETRSDRDSITDQLLGSLVLGQDLLFVVNDDVIYI